MMNQTNNAFTAEQIFSNVAAQDIERIIRELQSLSMERDNYLSNYNTVIENLNNTLNENDGMVSEERRKIRNIILTSETQNGKTEAIMQILHKSTPRTLSIISCDNKGDQMKQISDRLKNNGIIPKTLYQENSKKNKKLNQKQTKNLIKTFKDACDENKTCVLLTLNNNSQVSKLRDLISEMLREVEYVKVQVIHDEADLVNKGDYSTTIPASIKAPLVHDEWVRLFNDVAIQEQLKFIKRIWVSATPENCSLISEVKARDVFILPRKIEYVPVSDHFSWNGIRHPAISSEVERIKQAGSKEAIIFCASRLNDDHSELSQKLSLEHLCPVITYNGKGVKIFTNGVYKETYNGSISDAMAYLETGYNGPIIIVGHELMNRGISFISSRKSTNPLTASVMFYECKSTVCAVNIAQRIGRITGTSRMDLKRRALYCSTPVYEAYKNYLENQKKIYSALQAPENRDRYVADILKADNLSLQELGRDLDRKTLKKANDGYREATQKQDDDSAYASGDDELSLEDNAKMKKLIKEWKKQNNHSYVSEIFKTILQAPENRILLSTLNDQAFVTTICSSSHRNKWYLVFKKDGEYITLTQNAIDFLENN